MTSQRCDLAGACRSTCEPSPSRAPAGARSSSNNDRNRRLTWVGGRRRVRTIDPSLVRGVTTTPSPPRTHNRRRPQAAAVSTTERKTAGRSTTGSQKRSHAAAGDEEDVTNTPTAGILRKTVCGQASEMPSGIPCSRRDPAMADIRVIGLRTPTSSHGCVPFRAIKIVASRAVAGRPRNRATQSGGVRAGPAEIRLVIKLPQERRCLIPINTGVRVPALDPQLIVQWLADHLKNRFLG